MALPNKVLPGFVASLYMQPGAAPTPIATAVLLGTYATVSPFVVAANLLEVEAIPAFGQEDAMANFSVAGSRQSDKIPVQSAPFSLSFIHAWNPTNANLLLVRGDAYSGLIDRTYVIAFVEGANQVLFAFNARAGQFSIDSAPGAEAQCTFTLHPRGNLFGWSNNV